MRIILVTNASYAPPRGGSTRANRSWLERLVQNGHHCAVINPSPNLSTELKIREFRDDCRLEGISDDIATSQVWNGVHLFRTSQTESVPSQLSRIIDVFEPDCVLVSSEDFAQARLRAILRILPGKVVYLGHTPQFFPFGPESMNPNKPGTQAIAEACGTVVISNYMKTYCSSFLSHPIHTVHPPVYGQGPFADYGHANDEHFVTMINPCAVKGISIFLSIASSCPGLPFAALPGWGTTSQDLSNLNDAGVHLLAPCQNIDAVFSKTKILLVPSLWQEGFGLVVIEAMLRGIPVLASNLGGLLEAKMGTPYALPVNAISRYSSIFDDRRMPVPEIPQQDLDPWITAVQTLAGNDTLYRTASTQARQAAEFFVAQVDPDGLEHAIAELIL